MPRMRARFFVFLFFSLISLGQAYPFSYAYSLSQENTCACHRAGDHCMHDCSCCHHQGDTFGDSKDPNPGVSRQPCGGRSSQEILSFRSDPFLPAQSGILLPPRRRADFPEFQFYQPKVLHCPETPPPRLVFAT